MNVSFAYVEGVVKTLPIGYYAKRKVFVNCDRNAPSSFYDPLRDSITISYPQIAQGLMHSTQITENAIRAMVYHEVSHAIATPKDLKMNSIINVFEDERIETAFEGYYHGVDFKQNVREINGWDGIEKPDPNDPFSVYYHAMRFRDTTPELQTYIQDAIEYCGSSPYSIVQCAKSTWECITNTSYDDFVEKQKQKENEGASGTVEVKRIAGEPNGEPRGKLHDGKGNGAGKELNDFNFDRIFIDRDDDFTQKVAILFENFNKKCVGGTAIQTYSGIINPRNIVRNDYRYFDRIAKNVGNNKYGSIHINLFLDCSGSFCNNERATNQVLKALTEMENRYRFFTFTVIACAVGQKVLDNGCRAIKANGGTQLTRDIEPMFRRLQKPQSMNYNIVMYDGDADPDRNVAGKENAFGVFDKSNCFIISDYENQRHIEKAVKGARVVYSDDYVNELKDNVLKALSLALS